MSKRETEQINGESGMTDPEVAQPSETLPNEMQVAGTLCADSASEGGE
jgi:hypothetical protein